MVTNCPFCEIGDRIIKQNDLAILFLSNPRKVPGHYLVSPKRHIEKLHDLTSEELNQIFDLIQFAETKLLANGYAGCDIRQNYRPFLPQGRVKVDHMHFHIIPRNFEDDIYQRAEKYETDMFVDLTEEERIKYSTLVSG